MFLSSSNNSFLSLPASLLKNNPILAKFARYWPAACPAVVLGGIALASVKQIDAGEVGVKKLFGQHSKRLLGSGLHFINPLMDVETGCKKHKLHL